ncbi:clotting factor G beta subunit-like [Condylostylus longicornis]|uniref:clotting factor G beta subunit-like n=1 Tax=Condylostylus longicornis TaxID=2530218 RepID=UPI00244E12F3|nr:clotting factor G beta subunit-like [Condylostylus longicornis]
MEIISYRADCDKTNLSFNLIHNPDFEYPAWILVLDHHMKYTWNIKLVCIDFNLPIIPGDLDGQIVGWGAKSIDYEYSNNLQRADLKSLTKQECKVMVGANYKSEITNDKFCAINKIGSSACKGDSGSGFVIKKNV